MTDLPVRELADAIHEGFDTFYEEFKRLTRESRQCFDASDWVELHEASHRRIDLYLEFVARTQAAIAPIAEAYPQNLELWKRAHIAYAEIIAERPDVEVAETFFNAITRKIFRTVGVKPEIEFLENHIDEDAPEHPGLYRRFEATDDLQDLFARILASPRPALHFVDIQSEAEYLAHRFAEAARSWPEGPSFEHIDVLRVFFFRVREGYIVGRIRQAGAWRPLIIPVQPRARGMVVDGAIFSVEETLQVFSSTRAYMFVDVTWPSDLARFLGTLMPDLALSELYIAFAHHRHGKTLIYRELVEHMDKTQDAFIVAPGIKGLVMTVFTTASYRNVFKIIRDDFEKPFASRQGILESYRNVFRGRRMGRLADTQEFEHLAFEKARFTEECLHELLSKAPKTVRVEGDQVVVSHVYIEEKMTPLNIYLNTAPEEDAVRAIIDYGYAIKELAANNIFAGDLLWKNFGVTRFGRLVLYDYDEICPLLDCNFREIPEPRSYEEEMSATPFYAVDDADVFPEEFAPFIVPRQPALREAFLQHHADLLGPELWRKKQRHVISGELHIGLPYQPRYPEIHRQTVRVPPPTG